MFIDPSTGRVGRVLDFGALKASVRACARPCAPARLRYTTPPCPPRADNPGSDVLNGIAYTQRRGAEVRAAHAGAVYHACHSAPFSHA